MSFEDHTAADFERLFAVNVGGVFHGCKHAVIRFKEQGDGGVILNTGSVAGLVGWGGTRLRRHQGRGAPAHQGRGHRGGAARHPGQRDLPGGRCRTPASWPPAGLAVPEDDAREDRRARRRHPPARPAHHRRGLRRGRRVPRARTAPANVTGVLVPVDGGYVATMTRQRRLRTCSTGSAIRELFDLRSSSTRFTGGGYTDDPYPRVARGCASRPRSTRARRTSSPASRATAFFHGLPEPDRPHFSAFSYAACDDAYRNAEVFASSPDAVDADATSSA